MRPYARSVFINCPFDAKYRPLFEAVAFAIYDCGFYPRCAVEMADGTQVRIEKINEIIGGCRLAVHDISRTEVDRATGLPRFNMPLELGMFLGAKAFGGKPHARKAALILDVEPYRYQKYISDIAGQDIRAHRRQPPEAIRHVRDFLYTYCAPGELLPGGDYVVHRYDRFRTDRPAVAAALHLRPEKLTFRDLGNLVVAWMRANPLSLPSLS